MRGGKLCKDTGLGATEESPDKRRSLIANGGGYEIDDGTLCILPGAFVEPVDEDDPLFNPPAFLL